MSMTGGLGTYGTAAYKGIELALDEMNRADGFAGSPITAVLGDDRTSPQAGLDVAKHLIEVGRVNALIGALSSGVTIPVAVSVGIPAGMLQISIASTSPEITRLRDDDLVYRVVPTDAAQGAVLARIAGEKGISSAAVMYVNNSYGKGLAEAFGAAFTGEIVRSIAFDPDQNVYRKELRQAAGAGADALFLFAYPKDGTPIVRQAIEGRFFDRFAFADGMKVPELGKLLGAKVIEGAFGTAPQASGAARERFVALYRDKYRKAPLKPYVDAAYDAAILVGLAAIKAGSSNPRQMRDALRSVANAPGVAIQPGEFAKARKLLEAGEDIDYDGAAGPLEFDEFGDVTGSYAHWEFRKGKILTVRIVEPG